MLKLTTLYAVTTGGRYYCFNVLVGLVRSNDSGCCAGGSVSIGGVFSDRQVKGDDPDEKGYDGPPDWGWVWG
jgi:hypothetical protein